MYAGVSESQEDNQRVSAASHVNYGLLYQLEGFFEFFNLILDLFVPSEIPKGMEDLVDEETKIACLRFMQHVIIRSDFKFKVSEGFTQ